jgi:4-diphosphocytidyl-2-C-methyl-D-erythritol kinase
VSPRREAVGGRVRARAPAKVNPWLRVLGQRADGFHEVDLGVLALELGDEIELERNATGRVSIEVRGPCATPDVPSDERNLAVRAAASVLGLARGLGLAAPETGLHLRLDKHVPSQAGLGGGSSDAAAASLAARALLGIESDLGVSAQLAELGSDCVFFHAAAATGFARCTGRGEQVEVLAPPPPGWVVGVLTPDVQVSTARVYAALGSALCADPCVSKVPPDASLGALLGRSLDEARRACHNDLEGPALTIHPELRAWRALLDANGAEHFRLSGSGASFFGLFREPEPAREILADLEARAARLGLQVRGRWLGVPSGRGARLLG